MATLGLPSVLRALLEAEGIGTPYMGAYAVESREPRFQSPRRPLSERLQARLEDLGISQLYTHQAQALDAVQARRHPMVVTGTNSGKSLCYMLPAFELLASEPMGRVLTLYPTKALAQDQLSRFEALRPYPDFRCGVYDGDTPTSQRSALRRIGQVILTNPDMLHLGILPQHALWAKFFKSLRLVVIDEMHVYRGQFGSHVGNVVRRLLRIAASYGSNPTVVGCTATVANPGELFDRLTGLASELIDEDGSGQPRKTFAFWNPTLVSEKAPLSPNWLCARLMVRLAAQGLSSLVFCKSRVATELVLRYARQIATESEDIDPEVLDSYRSGYTPKERRRIENAIHQGKLLGLACTNAMELGVDIGALDAVVLNGYPGSISSFRQQCGRAGRGSRDGLAVYVAHEDPMEQFFLREPTELIAARGEPVVLNPSNPGVLEAHLRCAAYEKPLGASELEAFGARALPIAEELDRAGDLNFQGGRFYYPFHESPAGRVDLRGGGGEGVELVLDGTSIGTMESWRAIQFAHAGAIYLHRGAAYEVERLDLRQGVATLRPFEGSYFTRPDHQTLIESLVTLDERPFGRLRAGLGSVRITDFVSGYRKFAIEGGQVLETVELELPPRSFETVAFRLDFPAPEDPDAWPELAPGIHGVEHALSIVSPLAAGCDRSDLGTAWYVAFPETLSPAVFLFDRASGGMGLCQQIFRGAGELFQLAHRALAGCSCPEGCPKCLYLSGCEIANETIAKAPALAWLQELSQPDTSALS